TRHLLTIGGESARRQLDAEPLVECFHVFPSAIRNWRKSRSESAPTARAAAPTARRSQEQGSRPASVLRGAPAPAAAPRRACPHRRSHPCCGLWSRDRGPREPPDAPIAVLRRRSQ